MPFYELQKFIKYLFFYSLALTFPTFRSFHAIPSIRVKGWEREGSPSRHPPPYHDRILFHPGFSYRYSFKITVC
jgi:hypothetical protein